MAQVLNKNTGWRGLLMDPYMVAAFMIILLVSIPLVVPALDSAFWIKQYPFYFDTPLLALTALVLWNARVSAPTKRSQGFWGYLTLGFVFWLSVRLVGPFLTEDTPGITLVTDLLYLGFYLCLILALQLRPHHSVGDISNDLIRQLESTGATLLLFGLLIYFVVIPATFNPGSLITDVPSASLYVALNLFLFLRALALRSSWRYAPWRYCYNALVIATAGFVLLDGFDLASRVDPGFGAAVRGELFEALWLLPLLGFIAAGRLYLRNSSESTDSVPEENMERLIWAWRGKLTYLALIPPVLHIALEVMDWSDDLTRSPRELLVVLWALSAAGLSFVYDRRLLGQQRLLETKHQELNRQLEVAQRMDAVSRMAGGLAHDFNNLLMVIQGFASVLSSRLQNTEYHRDVEQISNAARRAGTLTEQLLTLGKREKRGVRAFSPNEVVAAMEPTLRGLVSSDIELRIELEETGFVSGEQGSFEDAVLNLVLNAREASAINGTISIKTGKLTVSADGLLADTLGPGNYGVVTITDNGRGMDEETRDHVFEPFFSRREGGTGLGLSMVYSFAREAGGTVEVDSRSGDGAQFRIILPARLPQEESGPVVAEPKSGPSVSRTILLVEDEDGVRDMLKHSLQAAGLKVVEACNGEEALETLNNAAQDIDLVVTDVVMPNMDGGTLARHIQGLDDKMPIIFMTGYAAGQLDGLGLLAENIPILKKPFNADVLVEEIEKNLPTHNAENEVAG